MSRLFFMTFEGKKRWSTRRDGSEQHPHESPALMTVPMVVLAIGSVGLGWLLSATGFVQWLEPSVGHAEHADPVLPVPALILLTLVAVAVGLVLAWRQYAVSTVPVAPPIGTALTRAARVDRYQDAVNDAALVEPGRYLTRSLVYGDKAVVDGTVTGVARSTLGIGDLLSRVQNGYARSYAAVTVVGIVVLAFVVLAARG